MYSIILFTLAALTGVSLVVTVLARRSRRPHTTVRSLVSGLLGVNGLMVLGAVAMVLVSLAAPTPVLAQGTTTTTTSSQTAMGAALATGLAAIGAGIAVGLAGAAAIGSITEKPEILGRTLIFVGLAEGIAIYGLIISFILLGR